MTSTNINDPSAITALLEQIKASVAWQELTAATTASSTPTTDPQNSLEPTSTPVDSDQHVQVQSSLVPNNEPNISSTNGSVASLLSQLQPFSSNAASRSPPSRDVQVSSSPSSSSLRPFSTPSGRVLSVDDHRDLTFRESLPILSELVNDESFLLTVKKMKEDQNILERDLWAEREALYTKYHDKFKVAQTKAQMIGTTVSQHEVDMMTSAFKGEISKFDRDRVIPAWDGLVSRQQQELAQLNTPTMFVTGESTNQERQQQVINVLETVIGTKPV